MLHVGMDMHKRFSVVMVADDGGNDLIKGKRLNNDEGEIRSFFESLGQEARVVLEAGGNWY